MKTKSTALLAIISWLFIWGVISLNAPFRPMDSSILLAMEGILFIFGFILGALILDRIF